MIPWCVGRCDAWHSYHASMTPDGFSRSSAQGLTVAVGADTIQSLTRSSPAGTLKSKVADGRWSGIGDSVAPGGNVLNPGFIRGSPLTGFVVTVTKTAGPPPSYSNSRPAMVPDVLP